MAREFYVDVRSSEYGKTVLWKVFFDAFQTVTATGAMGTAITCRISGVGSGDKFAFGKAVCHPSDKLDPVFGKKKAFERAIDDLEKPTRYLRTCLWNAFWSYHNPESTRKMFEAGKNYSSQGYGSMLGRITPSTKILRG